MAKHHRHPPWRIALGMALPGLLLLGLGIFALARRPATPATLPMPSAVILPSADPATAAPTAQMTMAPQALPHVEAYHAKNPDVVGYIAIEGTALHDPVLYTPGEDAYLYRNWEGDEDRAGSIYIDKHAILQPRDTNLLLHGHNMRNGSRFHTLLSYQDAAFCKQHPIIQFDTLYEAGRYEVVAAFRSQVFRPEDDVFKFYQFYSAQNEQEFQDYLQNIQSLALYNTGVTATYGDQLLTLSTCEYSQPNGRMVVVAKRVEGGP